MSFILPSIGGGIIAHQSGSSYSNTRSMNFDGTDDHLSCGDVDVLNSATNFTLSMWVNNHADAATVTHYFASGTGTICRVRKGGSGEIRFHIGSTQITTTSGHPYTRNGWQHVMVTVNGSTARVFLDGVLKVEGTSMPSMASTSGDGFFIGQNTNGTQRLNGEIDEFAIWDATLSDGGVSVGQTATQDVAAIYNSGVPNDLSQSTSYDTDRTGNLTHWWRMEEGSGSTVVNTANSGTNDATIVNSDGSTPTFSMNYGGFNRFSLSFDGTNDSLEGSANSSINFSGNLSVSAWVRQDTLSHGGIVSVGDDGVYPGMFHVHTSTTKLQFITSNSDGTANLTKTSFTPTVNEWVHILVSVQSGVSGGTVIYINGSVDKSSLTKTVIADTGTVKVFIGKKSYDANHVD